MAHMIKIEYKDELERKRLDYIIDKYDKKIHKQTGTIIFVEDSSFDTVFKELYAKFGQRVKAYNIDKENVNVNTSSHSFDIEVPEEMKAVETFVNYLLSTRKGVYKKTSHGTKFFTLHSNKGIVESTVRYTKTKKGIKVSISLEGIKEAVDLIGNELEKKLLEYTNSIKGEM